MVDHSNLKGAIMHIWMKDIRTLDLMGVKHDVSMRLFYAYAGWEVGFHPIIVQSKLYIIFEKGLTSTHRYILFGPLDTEIASTSVALNSDGIKSKAYKNFKGMMEYALEYNFRDWYRLFDKVMDNYTELLLKLVGKGIEV